MVLWAYGLHNNTIQAPSYTLKAATKSDPDEYWLSVDPLLPCTKYHRGRLTSRFELLTTNKDERRATSSDLGGRRIASHDN